MYADDTTLTTSAEDPCVLEHKMNYDMNLIQSWLSANKLTLNVKKPKYMLIGSQFKLSQINSDLTVKVNNTPLERVIKHARLPRSTKFANAPPPGLKGRANAPQWPGGWGGGC